TTTIMITMLYLSFLSLALLPGATARLFTIVNGCPFTVWHIFTGNGTGPLFPTGWQSPPLTSAQFAVPDNWRSGRIWGRRACDFSTNPGPNSCLDGGCNGGLQCDPTTGTGLGPVTVAEWTLQGDGNLDSYDVSIANGFNLPMAIIPSANCQVASCPVDLNPQCPGQLVGPRDPTGLVVGCKSACLAGLDNPAADSANCCTGTHNTQTTCPASGVQFYNYFKGNCPNAYAYAFDGGSGTALWKCDSTLNSDYRLTFCPCVLGLSSLIYHRLRH
ncbi:thaumatin-like protein, partial [Lactifluus subvellereus]